MATLRKLQVRYICAALVVIILLSTSALAQAKMLPYVEPLDGDWGGPDDPLVLDAAYFAGYFGRLDSGDDVDALALTFDRPANIMINDLLVPVCGDHFVDFYPSIAVIGPGLDHPTPDELAALPFDLPNDQGALIFSPEKMKIVADVRGERPLDSWQLFAQQNYDALSFTIDIPQAGDYIFAIWNADAVPGAYTLMTGAAHPGAEAFNDQAEFDAKLRLVSSGEWIGQSCD